MILCVPAIGHALEHLAVELARGFALLDPRLFLRLCCIPFHFQLPPYISVLILSRGTDTLPAPTLLLVL